MDRCNLLCPRNEDGVLQQYIPHVTTIYHSTPLTTHPAPPTATTTPAPLPLPLPLPSPLYPYIHTSRQDQTHMTHDAPSLCMWLSPRTRSAFRITGSHGLWFRRPTSAKTVEVLCHHVGILYGGRVCCPTARLRRIFHCTALHYIAHYTTCCVSWFASAKLMKY